MGDGSGRIASGETDRLRGVLPVLAASGEVSGDVLGASSPVAVRASFEASS